jgi:hypothetical protein
MLIRFVSIALVSPTVLRFGKYRLFARGGSGNFCGNLGSLLSPNSYKAILTSSEN